MRIFTSPSPTTSAPAPSVHQRFTDLKHIVHHRVINLDIPIHVKDKHFQVNKRESLHPLLALAKHYRSWTTFVTFAPYFPELEHNNNNDHLVSSHFLEIWTLPSTTSVQHLLPYISDEESMMTKAQLSETMEKIRKTSAYFSESLFDHHAQIFAQIHTIIQQARFQANFQPHDGQSQKTPLVHHHCSAF